MSQAQYAGTGRRNGCFDYFDYSYKGNDLCIPYHDILYIETIGQR